MNENSTRPPDQHKTLKQRFLEAVRDGKLGYIEDQGIIVTRHDFIAYFADMESSNTLTFLANATIEIGQKSLSKTKIVFRVRKGVYRVHEDAVRLLL